MNAPSLVIALDGPAGAGKSTVAKLTALQLGLTLLDTGAMYRCVGLACIRNSVSLEDPKRTAELGEALTISFRPEDPQRVLLDGEDVTEAIRSPEVSQAASIVSTHSAVRRDLVRRQKELVSLGGCILEGRDTTTVVAPEAPVKIFLTASVEERARRRWLELMDKGGSQSLQEVVLDVISRDYRDYTRSDSPLQLGEDVTLLETFALAPQQVAEKIVQMARTAGFQLEADQPNPPS